MRSRRTEELAHGRIEPLEDKSVAVLIEGISVVVRREAIERSYPGGMVQYEADCPNQTFCADEHLARIGLMSPYDVQRWVTELTEKGLVFLQDKRAIEIAVVDQTTGPTTPCDWLEFGNHDDGYVVAWLASTQPILVSVPVGWTLEDSLTRHLRVIPNGEIRNQMKWLTRENNVDFLVDRETGQRYYMGRVGWKD